MGQIRNGELLGYSTFQPLYNFRDQHIASQLLEDTNIDAQYTLGVHPMSNQFWQYPLGNVYQL